MIRKTFSRRSEAHKWLRALAISTTIAGRLLSAEESHKPATAHAGAPEHAATPAHAPAGNATGGHDAAAAGSHEATAGGTAAAGHNAGNPAVEIPGLPKWLLLDVAYRGKAEFQSGIDFIQGNNDNFYLSRMRMGTTLQPISWFKFRAQVQDARALAYRSPSRPAYYQDTADLRELFVQVGATEGNGVNLRLGRQEFAYGNERLVGSTDWTNGSRTFDAARLSVSIPGVKFDTFAAAPVKLSNGHFDRRLHGENFFGTYATIDRFGDKAVIEPYLFLKTRARVFNEAKGVGFSNVYTNGTRVAGRLDKWDYNAEAAYQWGTHAGDKIRSWAGSYMVGRVFSESQLKPRVHFEYSHASGDKKEHDHTRNTFDNLYPSNHDFYGITDQVSWRNIRNASAGFDLHVTHSLHMGTEYHEFFLASRHDGLYNYLGELTVLNHAAKSSHVGREWNVHFHYVVNRNLTLGGGFAHLFAGDYLKQTTRGAGYSAPYIALYLRP